MENNKNRRIQAQPDTQPRRKTKKRMPVWAMAIIDLLCVGVFLCTFAYFHHVNPPEDDTPSIDLPRATTTAAPISSPSISAQPSVTSAPTATVDPNANKFEDKFLPEGAPAEKTDSTYVTHNVNVNVYSASKDDINYHVAEIYVRDVTYLKTYLAGGDFKGSWKSRKPLTDMMSDVNAFVAMNGDQCSAHKTGVVVRNGVLYRETLLGDVCVLNYDGSLETYSKKSFDLDKLKAEGAWQVWSFGPMLLNNGQPMTEFDTDSAVARVNPRSVIGMIEPLHYLLLSVDGRRESPGIAMTELSQLMLELGCTTAYNLDGGDTSAMALNGALYSVPSGDRDVTDIIYIEME